MDEDTQSKGPRINLMEAIFLISFGVFIDFTQFFFNLILIGIVLNYVIGLFTWLTLYTWLKIRGISMWEDRLAIRILMFLLAAVGLEIFTAGAAPGWTIFTIAIVVAEFARKIPFVDNLAKE